MKQKVRLYVEDAIRAIALNSFQNEPVYCIALISRLVGTAYEGEFGLVKFRTTSFNDRGSGSAESKYGADFAITADISDNTKRVSKAIVFQAKLGSIESLPPSRKRKLANQIKKIINNLGYERPKILELVDLHGKRYPRVISGLNFILEKPYQSQEFSDYILNRVLTTHDGNTDPIFVRRIQYSSLPILDTFVQINSDNSQNQKYEQLNQNYEQLKLFDD